MKYLLNIGWISDEERTLMDKHLNTLETHLNMPDIPSDV